MHGTASEVCLDYECRGPTSPFCHPTRPVVLPTSAFFGVSGMCVLWGQWHDCSHAICCRRISTQPWEKIRSLPADRSQVDHDDLRRPTSSNPNLAVQSAHRIPSVTRAPGSSVCRPRTFHKLSHCSRRSFLSESLRSSLFTLPTHLRSIIEMQQLGVRARVYTLLSAGLRIQHYAHLCSKNSASCCDLSASSSGSSDPARPHESISGDQDELHGCVTAPARRYF
jgi:hypothetical protein